MSTSFPSYWVVRNNSVLTQDQDSIFSCDRINTISINSENDSFNTATQNNKFTATSPG